MPHAFSPMACAACLVEVGILLTLKGQGGEGYDPIRADQIPRVEGKGGVGKSEGVKL